MIWFLLQLHECRQKCHNILLDIITNTEMSTKDHHGFATTMANNVIYELFDTNYMVDLTTITKSITSEIRQEMVVHNKYGKSMRRLQVTLLTPL